MDETELYVTELKDHVIIQQQNEDQMYNEEDVLNISTEENVADEDVNHLVDEEVRTQLYMLKYDSLNNSFNKIVKCIKCTVYVIQSNRLKYYNF